ncbi:MAG: polyprenyl synthetase family protein [Planctomycetes bacterium]|nr:polyprenyl synthetase family protein [Planctomycetota bacterium]
MAAPDVGEFLRDTQAWVEPLLDEVLAPDAAVPATLTEAMRYAVLGGGKRTRPALARLVCRWCGGADLDVEAPAVSIELIHAYSLIHDDLPCMDDDDWRRGRPSCHKQFGEALAVLAGDGLQAHAFAVLSSIGRSSASDPRCQPALRVLARAAGPSGMVGGQVLDMQLTGQAPALARIQEMQRKKTGALIAAAAELGAIAARASEQRRATAAAWGAALGACFQAVDDVLDVTADRAELGKTPGKDAAQHKPTLVAALGLDGARLQAQQRAAEARELARTLGGEWAATGLQMVDFVLDRRS